MWKKKKKISKKVWFPNVSFSYIFTLYIIVADRVGLLKRGLELLNNLII